MGRKKKKPDRYYIVSDFLHGKSSMIFKDAVRYGDSITVTKHGLPHVVILSYEKYEELVKKAEENNEKLDRNS
ncbi:MAG: type II toxin-antitoxin system prevent-host-death family antitoxin [Endomicrobia bacterium]|nr:type II toxin-antitoxin system prevent-host-death family antitoxin [Endomicrobiia bacterium]MCL2506174.1 type II toxin-antitoxin system prevent-host-death family antitoxin [Endomicrobiia bacterium]